MARRKDYLNSINEQDEEAYRLDSKGYVVRRIKGKGASGVVAQKIV